MALTYNQAYDEICAQLNTYWQANSAAVNDGTVPDIEWPNIPTSIKLDEGNEPWQRFDLKFAEGNQKSMGSEGNRIFERSGTLTCQVFVPINKRGLESAHDLAKVAADAFEGKVTSGGVRFLGVALQTVGKSKDAWYQVNVSARFEYDEIK